ILPLTFPDFISSSDTLCIYILGPICNPLTFSSTTKYFSFCKSLEKFSSDKQSWHLFSPSTRLSTLWQIVHSLPTFLPPMFNCFIVLTSYLLNLCSLI